MFRNLAGNLVLHESIQTTDAKAKELRRIVERLLTKALRLGDDLVVDLEPTDSGAAGWSARCSSGSSPPSRC